LASEEIPAFYGTRRFISVYPKSWPVIPVLSQINPVHIATKVTDRMQEPEYQNCLTWTVQKKISGWQEDPVVSL
jgi:hypothetical protein